VLYFFFLGLFQSLLAAFLLMRKAKRRSADLFLLLLVISFAVHFLASFLLYAFVDRAYLTRGIMNFTLLTYGPLTLMYARKSKAESENVSTRWWLLSPVAIWAIPYCIILAIWIKGSFFDEAYLRMYNRSLLAVMFPLNVACFMGAIRVSRTFTSEQGAVKNLVRNISVTGIVGVLFCIALTTYVVVNEIPFGWLQEVARSIGALAILTICLAVARYALMIDRPRVLAFPQEPPPPVKTRPAQMTRERQQEIYEKLVEKVEQERLYLDPDFNMEKLTAATGYSRHQISEALNQYADISFYPFVNRFRVEQVCAHMKKAAAKDSSTSLNMLELSYACGFKSKSSFNEYFRRFTGDTPSQYWSNLHVGEKKI
jgi:AraC-like DNA-binding protein